MNYRHAYHAGNFADVLKHAVLALVIAYMKHKPAPFRVIDTHAGTGLYELTAEAAQKTGEWRDGIGRLLAQGALSAEVADILAPYIEVVRGLNPGGALLRYPGSPLLARRLMRHDDQLIANELHPDDLLALRHTLASEPSCKILALDGYVALRALLPPKERRGVVLIDPPFEVPGELDRLVVAAGDAKRRFETGTLLIWYPIKNEAEVAGFHRQLAGRGFAKSLIAELMIRTPRRAEVLAGCGLVLINPPFTLQGQLQRLLPALAARLGQDAGAGFRLTPLA